MWVAAIGLLISAAMSLGGCQLSLGEACGDSWCPDGQSCAASNSVHPMCIRAICGNGQLEVGEECDDSNQISSDGCEADCTLSTRGLVPATCAEIIATVDRPAQDGQYRLYFGRELSKPWMAYCLDMAGGASRQYLLLTNTDGANFSQYTAGGGAQGIDVRTSYAAVRFNPVNMALDVTDPTFATTSGSLVAGPTMTPISAMNYGSAGSCDGLPSGISNIDLRGTLFALSANRFSWTGMGIAVLSEGNQLVNLVGGGSCGIFEPSGEIPIQLAHE